MSYGKSADFYFRISCTSSDEFCVVANRSSHFSVCVTSVAHTFLFGDGKMKKTIKRILATVLTVMMLLGIVLMTDINITASAAEIYSGTCGENLTWTLDTVTGELVISGEGEMYDYDAMGDVVPNYSPWSNTGDTQIKSIVINDGITSIGDNAFHNGSNNIVFESIEIPNSISRIGERAFAYCESLENIYIGKNVCNIGKEAFYKTGYYNNESNWESNVLYIGNYLIRAEENLSGAHTVADGTILISSGSFRGCVDLVSIEFPTSLKYIGDYAFQNCEKLNYIDIPDSVIEIGECAFDYTGYYLNSSNWDNNALYIGNCLVSVDIGYESPKPCVIEDGTKLIADGVFSNEYVTSIYIPDSVKYICGDTFDSWNVKEIKVNIDNPYFSSDSYGALYSKDKTRLIEYPSGNEETDFEIPDSVIEIGANAFSYSELLERVVIPCSVVKVGDDAFSQCTGLLEVAIPNSVTYIGSNVFEGCTNLENVILSDQITQIGRYAFSNCDSIFSIIIPDNVTCVKKAAFSFCDGLTSMTFDNNIECIEYGAFKWCNNLTDIYYNGTEEEWNGIIIEEGNESLFNATIHFLKESEHTHSYSSLVTKEPTCKETGVMNYTCSCGDTYTEVIPMKEHNAVHDITPSTCKVAGMEYDFCSSCGETFNVKILPLNAHTWGEWQVTTPPTASNEGISTRVCSVCGEKETKLIQKLGVMKDEKTGIEIEFDDEYGSDVEIKVEEVFDGDSFKIIENVCGNNNSEIYDVSTVKNGEKVQPDGKVKVRIPIPTGFKTTNILVFYIDSTNGTATNIPTTVVNGYVEFETDHFSYYAIVEELGEVKSVSVEDISMSYKNIATITPTVEADSNVNYMVTYESSDASVATVDENGKITTNGTGSATITVTVTDEYGNTVTDTCKVNVSYQWWQWIIVIVLFGWLWY